ncbi:hypothetical protein [Bremerella cremea]|uniref:hypothetical protein n=1 Tax=Bremerella cremea TaxID=1031537 RepID=UPI0031EF5EEB
MSYRIAVYRTGRLSSRAFEMRVAGQEPFPCELHQGLFCWEAGSLMGLEVRNGILRDLRSKKAMLTYKGDSLTGSRYELGSETIFCQAPSYRKLVARLGKRKLFQVHYRFFARNQPWCEAVVSQHLPSSIPIAIILHSFYTH